MSIWKIHQEKKVSTMWTGANPNLVAEFKLENTVEWTSMGSLEDIGDMLYSVPYTFINEGVFLVRVRDVNTNVSLYSKIEVQSNEESKGFV